MTKSCKRSHFGLRMMRFVNTCYSLLRFARLGQTSSAPHLLSGSPWSAGTFVDPIDHVKPLWAALAIARTAQHRGNRVGYKRVVGRATGHTAARGGKRRSVTASLL
mmetsp:Transcript_5657/g.13096  ORF Transcript_5657/g.13096 Transcript_5657/m.13096 type:complete len:106 (-) Transcript_5657:1594-1911(-)